MKLWIFVGLGSFLGGVARYATARAVHAWLPAAAFPLGTFVANVAGCFLIGALSGVFERGGVADPALRLFLTVGFCGGFTTFSTFANENLHLLQGRAFLLAALYAGLSLACGLAAAWGGHWLARAV
ncbi:fluoride efflux transporter CrcB [Candidatus Spyradosoma sp. SGI.093]|uniref:fluoride efflux transporter CrcB n=1 Tax=Candidatus Spyradosoma sp. SGI.093 TaxID=3420583 RepID=UPI003D09388D